MTDKDLAPFIRAFGHQLRQPLSAAQFAADQNQQALDRFTMQLQAFDWLADAITDEAMARQALRPRAVSAALAKIPRLGVVHQENIPSDLRVLAAPGALEMVLAALLDNAQKHAPLAVITVTGREIPSTAKPWPPSARVGLCGPMVLLTVADTGPGVSARMRPLLFEAIPRSHGIGLRIGLWLCRLIVRAHGGDLWLDETSCGASFSSVWSKVPCPSGFKTMPPERRRQIAALGGKTAQALGAGHCFTSEKARAAGKKGGQRVSTQPGYMAQIGRVGSRSARRSRRSSSRVGADRQPS